jgi:DNA-binding Xre family transcriptional regulator
MISTKRFQVAVQYSNKTDKQIIQEARIDKSTYYKILNGTRINVSSSTLGKLCGVLNVSTDWILGLSEEMERK